MTLDAPGADAAQTSDAAQAPLVDEKLPQLEVLPLALDLGERSDLRAVGAVVLAPLRRALKEGDAVATQPRDAIAWVVGPPITSDASALCDADLVTLVEPARCETRSAVGRAEDLLSSGPARLDRGRLEDLRVVGLEVKQHDPRALEAPRVAPDDEAPVAVCVVSRLDLLPFDAHHLPPASTCR